MSQMRMPRERATLACMRSQMVSRVLPGPNQKRVLHLALIRRYNLCAKKSFPFPFKT